MISQEILFWIFSSLMLLCGAMVILNRNPVHSAMFLISVFLCMAGIYLLLEAFFIAIIQVLVYAGAVMVLFLFVIMLLDLKDPLKRIGAFHTLLGGLLMSILLGTLFTLLLKKPVHASVLHEGQPPGGLAEVIKPLFTNYMLCFELIGLLILVSMIGIVLISKRD